MVRIVIIFFLGLFFSASVYAQGWQWGKGSIGNNVASWPVATDRSGNEYVAGVSTGAISFDNFSLPFSENGNPCVLAKYDALGDFLWARSTQNGTHPFLISIATDTIGNCYLFGWLNDSSMGIGAFTLYNTVYPDAQYFIAKFNPDGDVLWATNAGGRSGGTEVAPAVAFNSPYAANMLGLGGITTDTNGNIYITTCFNLPVITAGTYTLTNTDATGATDDILLVKYDASGNVVWAKSSGGIGEDIPFGITVTPAGDLYIAGMFNSGSITFGPSVITDTSTGLQRWNAFIARYNSSGSPVWANGSGGTGMVYASGVASDASNNVYLTGGTAEEMISFGGVSITDTNAGNPVSYLVKFDASNNVEWYKTIGSPTGGAAWGYGIAMSPVGYIWVGGAFNDEVSIGTQVIAIPAGSVDPVFIASFDTFGNYIAGGALQSGSAHQSGMACDGYGSVYLCSDYKFPCAPFIVANDVLATIAENETWLYLAKYSPPGGPGGPGPGTPITLYNRQDTSICPSDYTVFLKPPRGYTLYTWSDGSVDTVLPIAAAGTYWVKAMDNTNVAMVDTINVTSDSSLCNCNVFMPNAFTPNGDGLNDTYGPTFGKGCVITKYAFSIYNRWGQRVFYTEDPYAKWDGTFNNANADMDVYMFYLRYSPNPNYPDHVKKGDVTLVR